MDHNRKRGGLWTPTNMGVVFSPMMSSFGGGSVRGFNGGGGGAAPLPVITQLSDILSSINAGINGSAITHNGYGFMLYSGEHAGAGANYQATMDVSQISTIRFVLMGGGGAANALNVTSGGASGGIEGLLDVSAQTAITLTVGSGGQASSSAATAGTGGTSSIKLTNGSLLASAEGGRQSGASGYSTTRSGTTTSGQVTVISRAYGGLGGQSLNNGQRQPSIQTAATISGAYLHGACSGAHGQTLSNDVAFGYGGGGGGTFGSTSASPGGPLGYPGGLGTSQNGTSAQGPSVSAGTSYGKNSIGVQGYNDPLGGAGGGAFGAPGLEVYDIGQGATGLVKIWWAANDGDAAKLSTVGNLYS